MIIEKRKNFNLCIVLFFSLSTFFTVVGQDLKPNVWKRHCENKTGTRNHSGMEWVPFLKSFVLFGGITNKKELNVFDVQSFDLKQGKWVNNFSKGAETRGEETGNVKDPGFKRPYFALRDKEDVSRLHPANALVYNQRTYVPWAKKIFAIICGHTVSYDPVERLWIDLKPKSSPAPEAIRPGGSLNWGALCADPLNKEIVLFGGCGVSSKTGGPGTWIYSIEKNEWRKLDLKIEPPDRALSQMAYDSENKKIVLFGGDHLDYILADTWVYDCQTRTWEEKIPAIGPSPRFGHALLYLQKSKKVLLIGGKDYGVGKDGTYGVIPFEVWAYDVVKNSWGLIHRFEENAPFQSRVEGNVAAVNEEDIVLFLASHGRRKTFHKTWLCLFDASITDAAESKKFGVKSGTTTFRPGPFTTEWYETNNPPTDSKTTDKFFKNIEVNKWVKITPPKWMMNRRSGWGTVTLDTTRSEILYTGGGHATYYGNDIGHYDIKGNRFYLSYKPAYALNYNFGIGGAGPYAFNGGPWSNHTYHAYTYDPTIKRLVYALSVGSYIMFYDPEEKKWEADKKLKAPFKINKRTTYLFSTPKGIVFLNKVNRGRGSELYLLSQGTKWLKLPLKGSLPDLRIDGTAAVYDSKRNQMIMITSVGLRNPNLPSKGQIWVYDFESGIAEKKNPKGWDKFKTGRGPREGVYLPKQDLAFFGINISRDGKTHMPFYDPKANAWFSAEIPSSNFVGLSDRSGNVDLGLVYDPKRELVWGILGQLRPRRGLHPLNALKIDRKLLELMPIE
ncbi:MAG: hypothetical protein COA79_06870 [Planctomycetota bacterium]|nr:MAG: hypothetical protein COA79_06870 [Planctomycetota bacterium]